MTECAVVFMNWLQGKDEDREGLTLGEEFCEFNSSNKPPF